MANFNYLDFFKTPSETDKKLFIKNINNEVVWSLAPFKIFSSIIQNNNIRINFTNNDFILIDFNNVYESKIALANLQSAINVLSDKTPTEIDKDVELYVNNLLQQTQKVINSSTSSNSIVYDFNLGSIWYHNDLVSDYDAIFINIPTTNNRAITTSIIISQGLTASMINSPISINSITYSVKWGNGTSPVGNINQTDVIGLTFITYNNVISQVLGQSSTYVDG